MGAEWFFAEHDEWVEPERAAFELVRGRVLDIGAAQAATAWRRSEEGSRRSRSTSPPVRSRSAAGEASATRGCSPWRRST
jgi:hypothetical protein